MSKSDDGTQVAIRAEALYLINLMLLPGLAFAGLLWLYSRHARSGNELTRCHLKQTVVGSVWAGVLLTIVTLAILALGGLWQPATWVVLILYFVSCHAALILVGVLGLSRAIAGQPYIYPIIGSKKW